MFLDIKQKSDYLGMQSVSGWVDNDGFELVDGFFDMFVVTNEFFCFAGYEIDLFLAIVDGGIVICIVDSLFDYLYADEFVGLAEFEHSNADGTGTAIEV